MTALISNLEYVARLLVQLLREVGSLISRAQG